MTTRSLIARVRRLERGRGINTTDVRAARLMAARAMLGAMSADERTTWRLARDRRIEQLARVCALAARLHRARQRRTEHAP